MANQYGLFWDSISGDRIYNSDSFEEWLKKFFTTGVFNGDCQVVASSGMTITVMPGYANVDGKVRFFDTATNLVVATASATAPRIDTVVVERNDTDREISLKLVTGALSGSNPVPTAPVRSGGVYQIVLAQIYVATGATEILQSNITDTRADTTICGWVTGTVDQLDVSQLTAQALADLNETIADAEDEFDTWFQSMRDQLSTDAAGHLQNEIDDINDVLPWQVLNITLASASWSSSEYVISNAALTLDKVKFLTVPTTITTEQTEALQDAQIRPSAEAAGSITLHAYGDVPEIDIPIQIVIANGSIATA